MKKDTFIQRVCTSFIRLALSIFIVLLVLGVVLDNSYAQKNKRKKNKNGNDQVDPEAQRRAYIMELNKFWSFGYENYKNGQYDDANKYFWKVTSLDTINKFPKIYRYLGDSYFKLEKPDTAKLVFELGIKKYPEDVYLHRMVGYISDQTEQIDVAIVEYEKVVELDSESIDDWKRLAALYVKADRIEGAIGAYDKILALNPDDVESQKNMSNLILSTGDIEAAMEAKEKVREQDPQNSQVRFDLGKMYFDQGNYDLAIERFNDFLGLISNDVQALEYIGVSCQRLEKNREAIAEFKKILAIQPDNKKVMAEISRCYRNMDSFATARTYANKAISIDRQYGMGWIVLGEAYEAAAENCIERKNGQVEFNDKLVYELANRQYKKALSDFEFKNEAERHMSYLRGFLPTQEDKFMHKDQKKAQGECYKWIY